MLDATDGCAMTWGCGNGASHAGGTGWKGVQGCKDPGSWFASGRGRIGWCTHLRAPAGWRNVLLKCAVTYARTSASSLPAALPPGAPSHPSPAEAKGTTSRIASATAEASVGCIMARVAERGVGECCCARVHEGYTLVDTSPDYKVVEAYALQVMVQPSISRGYSPESTGI